MEWLVVSSWHGEDRPETAGGEERVKMDRVGETMLITESRMAEWLGLAHIGSGDALTTPGDDSKNLNPNRKVKSLRNDHLAELMCLHAIYSHSDGGLGGRVKAS